MLSKLNMQVLELSYFIDELVIDLPQAIFFISVNVSCLKVCNGR